MVSLIVHAVLGLAAIGFIVASNPQIFRRAATPALSTLECAYYIVGVASIAVGWYFNIRFVMQYSHGATNGIWGPGSWAEYIRLMFVNPASSSASEDFIIGNVILLPLFTIVDGRRRGIRHPWLYFVTTLFASFSFGWAFYLATVERQRRVAASSTLADAPA